LLGADAPLCGQVESVVDDWLSVGGGDGDYGDLSVGFLVDFGAEGGQLLAGGRAEDVGEIVDVALRLVVGGSLGLGVRWRGGDQYDESKQQRARSGAAPCA